MAELEAIITQPDNASVKASLLSKLHADMIQAVPPASTFICARLRSQLVIALARKIQAAKEAPGTAKERPNRGPSRRLVFSSGRSALAATSLAILAAALLIIFSSSVRVWAQTFLAQISPSF
jgi:hypothetical protein